ncbi:hypothetical protein TNCT_292531 [Trichonephila clavata]|uniref:Uncharacterized protein n=1 Tax=Trichonephila clavata TaxID=2740835 RepID=A0A8X6GM77_TRICU|nr:hypothetical protein TNCT_292531 [Trichonephila clavata]
MVQYPNVEKTNIPLCAGLPMVMCDSNGETVKGTIYKESKTDRRTFHRLYINKFIETVYCTSKLEDSRKLVCARDRYSSFMLLGLSEVEKKAMISPEDSNDSCVLRNMTSSKSSVRSESGDCDMKQ